MEVLYEDNHIIIINKAAGELVQGDRTGDTPLVDKVKEYIKVKYDKPGNVYLGVVHRLDRPTSGIVMFAKTSKALSRLNDLFRHDKVEKSYWAIVSDLPQQTEGKLVHYLVKNARTNKSTAYDKEQRNTKKAILRYKLLAQSERYYLLDVDLETGRHHQIRCQLSKVGSPIKGDLKYGARRSNPDGSISLHARRLTFIHPVSKKEIDVVAPVPDDRLWKEFERTAGR